MQAPALRNIGIDRSERAPEKFQCDHPVERVHANGTRSWRILSIRGRTRLLRSPYLHATHSSGRRYRSEYEHRDHLELLTLLNKRPCPAILSGDRSALKDEKLPGCRSLELPVMSQAGGRTEKLWFNFTPDRVHWARHAGRNHTHRQRIKRRVGSWARRFAAMPPAQRLAALSG